MQCWPFCWWLAIVLDHYSRRVIGFAVFFSQPTSEKVRQFLGQVVAKVGAAPKYLVSDHGPQFCADGFKDWCKRRGIRQRLGAISKAGSIAVLERTIRSLKDECCRLLAVVSLLRPSFRHELELFMTWYNGARPHTTLAGATPDERYFQRRPACRKPRFETRATWPRASPCASPQTLVKGRPGAKLQVSVDFVAGRRHLPRVTIRRAA
jgi:putative transposase